MDEIPAELKSEIAVLSKAVVQWVQTEIQTALLEAVRKPLEKSPVFAAVVAISKNRPDDRRMEAIDRLAAHRAFSRRALFHPSRWAALADGFTAYCIERELTAEQAWNEIIRPALIFGLDEADRKAGEKPLIEFWRTARREVRREIEKTILDGKTLDRRGEVELPDDENFLMDWFDFEPEGGLSEREAELFRRIVETLTLREFEAIAYHPTDKAGLMARKRGLDKIRRAGLDALVSTAQTLKQD